MISNALGLPISCHIQWWTRFWRACCRRRRCVDRLGPVWAPHFTGAIYEVRRWGGAEGRLHSVLIDNSFLGPQVLLDDVGGVENVGFGVGIWCSSTKTRILSLTCISTSTSTRHHFPPHTTLSDPSQMAYVDAIHTDVALVVLFHFSCHQLATNQVSCQHLISIRVVTHMGISTLCSRRDWVAGCMGTLWRGWPREMYVMFRSEGHANTRTIHLQTFPPPAQLSAMFPQQLSFSKHLGLSMSS